MKKETHPPNTDELQNSADDSDDDSDPSLYEPKQSPAPGASKYAKCERRIRARDQKEDGAVVKDLEYPFGLFPRQCVVKR